MSPFVNILWLGWTALVLTPGSKGYFPLLPVGYSPRLHVPAHFFPLHSLPSGSVLHSTSQRLVGKLQTLLPQVSRIICYNEKTAQMQLHNNSSLITCTKSILFSASAFHKDLLCTLWNILNVKSWPPQIFVFFHILSQ